MKKFTKIVATVSDKRCDVDFIRDLFDNGMNVVRMNSAHLSLDGFTKIVNNVRQVSERIGILIDTKGPEIRTTNNDFPDRDTPIAISAGDRIRFVGNPEALSSHDCIALSYTGIADDVRPGDHLLIDDGELDFVIDSIDERTIFATALNGGSLGARKSVNIPGVSIKLPSLTPRDITNIGYAIDLGIDFIAHSFVRSADDVRAIQSILDERGSSIKIISKIENQEGIDNFDEILEASYGIMIARGDLGIEIPAERIPGIQKSLIDKCIRAHKPVIVATQMLHSMISNPRPTRAEVSDIANAVYQHTDALMLSGETAYGSYPVEAVATMTRVALEAERSMAGSVTTPVIEPDVTSFLARQAVKSNCMLGTRAIITDSYTGRTARYIASYRGMFPTLALCYRENVVRLLSLSYGVWAIHQPPTSSSRQYLRDGLRHLLESKRLTLDDSIAYLGGGFGEGRGTTFLEINKVSEVMENYCTYSLPNLEDVAQTTR
ncbi:MAG: pyruvate kinase [Bacteroidales bacterium 52_46]|nr:MAG: pyruvate kinase [Bacteroidales bacterium 52_46]